jgi:DNA processing protein
MVMSTIALLSTPGVGQKTVSRSCDLVAGSMNHEDFLHPDAMIDVLRRVKERYSRTRLPTQAQLEKGIQQAGVIMDRCAKEGIEAITRMDQRFPSALARIPDPPSILYYRGEVGSLQCPKSVAIVGTRKPSTYGRSSSRRLAELLANDGFAIVSGLALGSDQAAHEGCLNVKGTTIAFMAHGLDRIRPASNERLASDILDSGGCLVSEYAPGVAPQRGFYVQRNRLQSGLSSGTIIIETAKEGGTMHTARFALKQGKVLGCFLHPPSEQGKHREGNEILLQEEGALPIGNADQLNAFVDAITEAPGKIGDAAGSDNGSDDQLSIFPAS